jgi:DNA-binding protein YbaB
VSETSGNGPGNTDSDQAEAFDLAAFMVDFEKHMTALRKRAEPVRPLIEATSVRIESDRHEVAVTANVSGDLVDVEFLPGAASLPPTELAALILATYQKAATTARGRTDEIVEGFLDHHARTRNLARRLVEQAEAQQAGQQESRQQGDLSAADATGT